MSLYYVIVSKYDRDTYVVFKQKELRGTLLEVNIWDVDSHLKEGYIAIPVEAKTLYHGQVVKDSWNFTAYLQDGEWYFDYCWVDI